MGEWETQEDNMKFFTIARWVIKRRWFQRLVAYIFIESSFCSQNRNLYDDFKNYFPKPTWM